MWGLSHPKKGFHLAVPGKAYPFVGRNKTFEKWLSNP